MIGWDYFIGSQTAALARVTDQPFVLYTTSGRAAIALALQELGIGRGDQVLVPTYHCPTMVSPIVDAGGEAVFYAIGPDGLPLVAELEGMALPRVRAMLAVHYFGIPQAFDQVREFCDRRGIALIEDCAHAFFGAAGERPVGAWGDFAVASLTKFFPVSEGGCLVTARQPLSKVTLRSRGWVDSARQLSRTLEYGATFGRLGKLTLPLRAAFALRDYLRGRGSAAERVALSGAADTNGGGEIPEFNAALARRRPAAFVPFVVRRVNSERIAANRRRNYRLLAMLLADLRGVSVLRPSLPDTAVPYVLPLWVDDPERSYRLLRAAGVPIFRWDALWPGVPELHGDWGLRWSHHVFQLGCHQDLSEDDMGAIAATIKRYVGAAS